MFHSVRDQVCKDCPANSMSTEEAVSVCPCSEGFYRNTDPEEGPDVECTGDYQAQNLDFCGLKFYFPL